MFAPDINILTGWIPVYNYHAICIESEAIGIYYPNPLDEDMWIYVLHYK